MSAPPPSTALPRRALRALALVLPLSALVTLLALLAGCGSASTLAPEATATGTPSATASFPVTVTAANGTVRLDSAPKRIVSLSPTATEMLYAMGAGSQVVAVDDQSDYPADAAKTKLSGFQPSAEAVAGYTPDLVVFSENANGLLAGLNRLQIPALELPAATNLDASYQQETVLGQATGHVGQAAAVIADTKKRVAAAIASVPTTTHPLKVYHELDPTYFSATSSTFIGGIYKLFGLADIADAAKDTAGGYPQLSAEFVVSQAPDLIVLADSKCCKQDAATVAQRPAFAEVPAVKNHRVISVDDDIASRWGPRVSDFAEQIAKALGGN